MISQIIVRNFQSHRETVLDLDFGVNCLVGLTGSGKSVIFKALDWVFRNRPLGTEYRSWWVEPDDPTQVEIVLKEGQRIGRIRTNSDNYYYIDKKEFRAFGNGPPPQPVLDLLNLSDVNFQAQTDPSFLISNSSGEVARYLNKASHLDVIDQVLSSIASTLRKEKEDLEKARKDLEQTREQLVLYDWLPEVEEKLVGLERLQESVISLNFQQSGLAEIIMSYDKVEGELIDLKEILGFGVEIERLTLLGHGIENQNVHWEQLAAIVDQYEKVEKELTNLIPLEGMGLEVRRLLTLEEEIKITRQEYYAFFNLTCDYERSKKGLIAYDWLPKAEQEWSRLDELRFGVQTLKNNRVELRQVLEQIDQTGDELKKVESDREKFRKEFDRLMPNICPLCSREIRRGMI